MFRISKHLTTHTHGDGWGDGWRGRGTDEEQQPRVVPWGDYRVSVYAWGATAYYSSERWCVLPPPSTLLSCVLQSITPAHLRPCCVRPRCAHLTLAHTPRSTSKCGMSDRNAARAIEHGQRPCDWTPSHLLPGLHRICSQPSHASPRPSCWVSTCWVCARERKRAKVQACAEYQHSSLCTGLRAGLERQVMTL